MWIESESAMEVGNFLKEIGIMENDRSACL